MKKVLIIDDNRELMEVNASGLRKIRGLYVSMANDGSDAIKRLAKEAFDLVITDFRMPNTSGSDVVVAMRSGDINSATPVIILTGYSAQIRLSDKHWANVQVLEKPVTRWQLTELVESLIGSSKVVSVKDVG